MVNLPLQKKDRNEPASNASKFRSAPASEHEDLNKR